MWWKIFVTTDWATTHRATTHWGTKDLRQRAPALTTALLAAVLVLDIGHFVAPWLAGPHPPAALGGDAWMTRPLSRPHALDPSQIISAHLFGTAARAADDNAPESALDLALSGVIATSDPGAGSAILGRKGMPSHLYHTGDIIVDAQGVRLQRVFADRVALDIGGRIEVLKLPRKSMQGAALLTLASRAEIAAASDAQDGVEQGNAPMTAAASWFSNLDAERNNVDGKLAGMRLHPEGRLRHQYGFRDGDILTAINGIEITDPEVLDRVLSDSAQSLSLTYTRNGVSQTTRVSVND
jgi:general secretion pathway protein C